MDWYGETFRATVVLLAASVVLLVPGSVGLGASLPLVVAFGLLAGLFGALREPLSRLPTVARHDTGAYGELLWLGPAVAAGVCLVFLGATAAELQALGGLVGLVGMVNYFLRPLYRAGYALASYIARAV